MPQYIDYLIGLQCELKSHHAATLSSLCWSLSSSAHAVAADAVIDGSHNRVALT